MSEQDKNLIAYCGLYCGDCINYKGEIADLARDLRKVLRGTKFDRFARGLSNFFKEFKNYQQCYEVLGAMLDYGAKGLAEMEGGHLPAKSETAARKRISKAVGNARNLRLVKSWTSSSPFTKTPT